MIQNRYQRLKGWLRKWVSKYLVGCNSILTLMSVTEAWIGNCRNFLHYIKCNRNICLHTKRKLPLRLGSSLRHNQKRIVIRWRLKRRRMEGKRIKSHQGNLSGHQSLKPKKPLRIALNKFPPNSTSKWPLYHPLREVPSKSKCTQSLLGSLFVLLKCQKAWLLS